MAITEFSKAYHEKMFPGYHSKFLETDPEFIERFDNFAFDEVVNQGDLDDRTRFMAILATLLGCQGIDEYRAIRNMRILKRDPQNMEARSELEWASAMAENGILKIGKASSFQAHQIEHQLGAYTDCNHGQGLAVIHPVLYRKLCEGAPAKFSRFAVNVFGVSTDGKTETEVALAGVAHLAAFIKEMGLPTAFADMGIGEDVDYRSVADSTNIITNGCFKPLTHDEIFEILMDCR